MSQRGTGYHRWYVYSTYRPGLDAGAPSALRAEMNKACASSAVCMLLHMQPLPARRALQYSCKSPQLPYRTGICILRATAPPGTTLCSASLHAALCGTVQTAVCTLRVGCVDFTRSAAPYIPAVVLTGVARVT